ncbi:hypothetical protein FBF48_10680 [Streptococcus salivarius]|uniref:Uncharacterized protein n=1 Tax=Streptococcus salivarius TaxID=1304 RepID=A0AAX2UZR6_STRSL|nr:hypothetical protein [Streptococcus salivarius]TNF65036.1 hypothetical protein FBF48_10680 [Streptococcus salivarius]
MEIIKSRFVIPATRQVVDLVVEIDRQKLADEMARRCLLNSSMRSQILFGHIKASIVEVKE